MQEPGFGTQPFLQCEFIITEKALRQVARLAVEKGTGARGLRSILVRLSLACHSLIEPFVKF
jgi:hypothetical protein